MTDYLEPVRVVIESPLSGDRARNKRYARLCALDCLERGEAPYASHLLYDDPDILDDTIDGERERGMRAGFVWAVTAEKCVVYTDLGVSSGMEMGMSEARDANIPIERRQLPPQLRARLDVKVDTWLVELIAHLGALSATMRTSLRATLQDAIEALR